MQRKDSKTCPDLCRQSLFLCQNMSLEALNPKMMVENVAWNEKIHIYSKFGAILFTIVNFSFLRQTRDGNTKWKMRKFTIVDEFAPDL